MVFYLTSRNDLKKRRENYKTLKENIICLTYNVMIQHWDCCIRCDNSVLVGRGEI